MASGTAPLIYQWMDNATNLANGPGISGATTADRTFINVSSNNPGDYSLVVTNAYGSITSSVATLTVVLSPTIVGFAANPNGSLTLQLWFVRRLLYPGEQIGSIIGRPVASGHQCV